jgi:Nif-specific regulatory protein
LQRFSSETKKNFSNIAADAEERILAYPWPGNVRELANAIERAVVLGDGPLLTVHHLPVRVIGGQPKTTSGEFSYHDAVNTYRRELIVGALAAAQGNRAAAAKTLGLHRTHLMKLMKALGVH